MKYYKYFYSICIKATKCKNNTQKNLHQGGISLAFFRSGWYTTDGYLKRFSWRRDFLWKKRWQVRFPSTEYAASEGPVLSTCMNTVGKRHIISVCLFCAQKYREQPCRVRRIKERERWSVMREKTENGMENVRKIYGRSKYEKEKPERQRRFDFEEIKILYTEYETSQWNLWRDVWR